MTTSTPERARAPKQEDLIQRLRDFDVAQLLAEADDPSERFAKTESLGGIVLLVTTLVALGWANSPWSASYFHLWETPIGISVGGLELRDTLHHWINDGLMAVFFLVVGLEIKREIVAGELASMRRAALPIAGAIGGMVVPALIYVAVNLGTGPGLRGWGTPMATDIAFALGIMALLGRRAPAALKIFLAALAIVDDLGAVLVIAFFYTAELSFAALGVAGIALGVLVIFNRTELRHPAPYLVVGLVLWGAFLHSGIHATVAGVLLALTIPATTRLDPVAFVDGARKALIDFVRAAELRAPILANPDQLEAVHDMERVCEQVQAPLQKMEYKLHRLVAFGIVPLFALANAGITFGGVAGPGNRVTLGVLLGLFIGKPLGITFAAWLAVRLRLAVMPKGTPWRAVIGVAFLGGIGFTMSLFIASLAFGEGLLLDQAKIGVLAGSLASGVLGWFLLTRVAKAEAAKVQQVPVQTPPSR